MGVKDFFVDISMIPWFGDLLLSFLVNAVYSVYIYMIFGE